MSTAEIKDRNSKVVVDDNNTQKANEELTEPVRGCFIVHSNEKVQFDICCDLKPDCVGHVPQEQQDLYADIEDACTVLRNLSDTDDSIKQRYFDKLLSLSQVGLVVGESSTANTSLEHLKREVLTGEGARIKNTYMKKLGRTAIFLSCVLFILFLFDSLILRTQVMACICLIGIGTFAGSFISFGARKFDIIFEELAVPEKDMMNPLLRLLYTFIGTLIFSLLLLSGVVDIKIGSLETAELLTSPVTQLTIGAVCGLIESRIGVSVYNRAVSIIGN